MLLRCVLLLISLLFFDQSYCQHHEDEMITHHRVVVSSNISIIPEGVDLSNTLLVVPSLGIDYEYFFNERWAISSKNDIILQQYVIESREDGKIIERQRVFVTTVTGVWEAFRGFSIFLGGGVEWEADKNYGLIKVGVEYKIALNGRFDVAIPLYWDVKEEYSTISTGISLGINF